MPGNNGSFPPPLSAAAAESAATLALRGWRATKGAPQCSQTRWRSAMLRAVLVAADRREPRTAPHTRPQHSVALLVVWNGFWQTAQVLAIARRFSGAVRGVYRPSVPPLSPIALELREMARTATCRRAELPTPALTRLFRHERFATYDASEIEGRASHQRALDGRCENKYVLPRRDARRLVDPHAIEAGTPRVRASRRDVAWRRRSTAAISGAAKVILGRLIV